MSRLLWVVVLWLGLFNTEVYAQIQVPKFTATVVDQGAVLSPKLRDQLRASLEQFKKKYGPQIALLTVKDLESEPIESFSIRVADQWKLGSQKVDNGVLMVLSAMDRSVRIEVGQGLEGDLPDALAGRIISDQMIPQFKAGKTEAGIVLGLQSIAKALGGSLEGSPAVASGSRVKKSINIFPLLILFFLFFPHIFGRRRGGVAGGLLTGMILGSAMGGRSRSFGGGGFGGGGFSGGGSSGSW